MRLGEGLGTCDVPDRMENFMESRCKYPANHFVAAKISQNEDGNPTYPGCLQINYAGKSRSPWGHFLVQYTTCFFSDTRPHTIHAKDLQHSTMTTELTNCIITQLTPSWDQRLGMFVGGSKYSFMSHLPYQAQPYHSGTVLLASFPGLKSQLMRGKTST